MNIQSFAMPSAAYSNPLAYGDLTGLNLWAWILSHLFADQKFMSIFSVLFGAGIILITEKKELLTGSSVKLHYTRNLILATHWIDSCPFNLVWRYFGGLCPLFLSSVSIEKIISQKALDYWHHDRIGTQYIKWIISVFFALYASFRITRFTYGLGSNK